MKFKSTLLVFVLLVSMFLAGGCQWPRFNEPVKVFINGEGGFPPELAGRWVSEKQDWEFVFNEDGAIVEAIIALGRVRIVPGQTTKVPMRMDGTGTYEPGQWVVTYTPGNRELVVEAVIKHFRAELGPNWVEGSTKDLFAGSVSEDGTEWVAEWITIPHYTAYVPEPHDLPVDPEDTVTTLVFKKAE